MTRPRIRRLLLVFKRSFLEHHLQNRSVLKRLDADARRRVIRSDLENRLAIQAIVDEIMRSGLTCDIVWRGQIASLRAYDLVLTVGGDGTLFSAAHYVRETPVLAVNSDPTHSLGLFAGATRRDFRERFRAALAGRLRETRLARMRVRLNGRGVGHFVLNDVLYAARNPAEMARYRLDVDGRREDHRGSGLWISTAAGSTAAILSAGGRKMPVASRRLQVRAREPYRNDGTPYRLISALARRRVSIQSFTTEGAIWLDGARTRHNVDYGDVVTLTPDAPPLTVLGFDRRRRDGLFR